MAKQTNALATSESGGLPDCLKDYQGPLGTEDIGSDEITLPRLKIGQSMTPQVKDGLIKEGALFLNITSAPIWNPGDAPIPAVIVARSREFILWRDQLDGGGILARAKREQQKDGSVRYRWDKPNQSFENRVGGKVKVTWETKTFIDENNIAKWGSEIPGDPDSGIAAGEHFNFLFLLPSQDNMLALATLAKTGVKVAKGLNAVLTSGRSIPLFARRWALSTVDETSDDFGFKNWKIQPDGFIGDDLFPLAKRYFDEYSGKTFAAEKVDDAPKDQIPF